MQKERIENIQYSRNISGNKFNFQRKSFRNELLSQGIPSKEWNSSVIIEHWELDQLE